MDLQEVVSSLGLGCLISIYSLFIIFNVIFKKLSSSFQWSNTVKRHSFIRACIPACFWEVLDPQKKPHVAPFRKLQLEIPAWHFQQKPVIYRKRKKCETKLSDRSFYFISQSGRVWSLIFFLWFFDCKHETCFRLTANVAWNLINEIKSKEILYLSCRGFFKIYNSMLCCCFFICWTLYSLRYWSNPYIYSSLRCT